MGLEVALIGRLLIAALLGSLLGLERSIAGKHAGMRTYAMVSLGSCLFIVIERLAAFQFSIFSGLNPLQIAGSIVIGIGFIGAGLAAVRGDHAELTTASGIWVAAGVGMACGFGYYLIAAATAALGYGIFSLLLKVENKVRRRYGTEME